MRYVHATFSSIIEISRNKGNVLMAKACFNEQSVLHRAAVDDFLDYGSARFSNS